MGYSIVGHANITNDINIQNRAISGGLGAWEELEEKKSVNE